MNCLETDAALRSAARCIAAALTTWTSRWDHWSFRRYVGGGAVMVRMRCDTSRCHQRRRHLSKNIVPENTPAPMDPCCTSGSCKCFLEPAMLHPWQASRTPHARQQSDHLLCADCASALVLSVHVRPTRGHVTASSLVGQVICANLVRQVIRALAYVRSQQLFPSQCWEHARLLPITTHSRPPDRFYSL